jgi:hypothetical protein
MVDLQEIVNGGANQGAAATALLSGQQAQLLLLLRG